MQINLNSKLGCWPLSDITVVSFVLIAYQPSRVIPFRSHPCKRIVAGVIKGSIHFPRVLFECRLLHLPRKQCLINGKRHRHAVNEGMDNYRQAIDGNQTWPIKWNAVSVVSILLYGCTTWTLTKRLEKKLDGNYRRMLWAILNKSGRQHSTKHQLYGHLPPITKTIQVRQTRHCWRSRDELISDVLLWTPTFGRAKAGRPAWTYIQQLCEDTGCSPEDLPEAMNDREKWWERVWDIHAGGMTWWWWWWWFESEYNSVTKDRTHLQWCHSPAR